MNKAEGSVEKKKPIKAKKNKKQHTKKQKIDDTNKDSKEVSEDNSVFAVTERLLQNKKAKKEKKKLEGKQKKENKIKTEKVEKFAKVQKFFEEEPSKVESESKRPKWFMAQVKPLVTSYLVSVDNYEKDATLQNETIKKQNEKNLYSFFQKISKQLGEDMEVLKDWFHHTKKRILTSETLSKPVSEKTVVLKNSIIKRKIKAIAKETTECPVPKSTEVPAWFDEEFSNLLKIRNKAKRDFKENPTEENKTAYRLAFKKVKIALKSRKSSSAGPKPQSKDNRKPKAKNFGTKKVNHNKTFGAEKGNHNKTFGAEKGNHNKTFGTEKGNHNKTFGTEKGNHNKTFGSERGNHNKTFGSKPLKTNNKTFGTQSVTPNKNGFNLGITTNSNRKHIKFDD